MSMKTQLKGLGRLNRLEKSTKEQNIDNKNFSIDSSTKGVSEELIKRRKYGEFFEHVEVEGKHFLALGVNKITENFDSYEELEEYIATNWLDVLYRVAVTINQVINHFANIKSN